MSALLRCLLSLCLLTGLLPAWAQSSLRNEQVQVELLAHAPQGVQAGQTFWLGLKIEHAPHWHTYWQNPGDSGLPTQLHWQLPAGLQAGEIAWPLPKKIPIGSLANYGYEGTVLLAVPVSVTPQFQAPITGKLRVALQAEWLVCRQECICYDKINRSFVVIIKNNIPFRWFEYFCFCFCFSFCFYFCHELYSN